MGRRFVDAIWIRQRMQAKDDRYAREAAAQRRNAGRLAFLPAEVLPYAAVEIVHVPVSDVERTIEDAQRHDAIERVR
jgi:hypothetical protein